MVNEIDEVIQLNIDVLPELQDFTTYEVIDPWGGVINVTEHMIDVINEPGTGSGCVRKIFPADTFGNFVHQFKATINSLDPTQNIGLWAVTNGASDYYQMYKNLDGLGIVMFRTPNGVEYRIAMYDWSTYDTGIVFDDYRQAQPGIEYTLVVERNGNQLTCMIYDGYELVDTLSIICNQTAFNYLLPHYSYRVGASGIYGSATIKDYRI